VPLTVVAILSVSVAQHRLPALENPTRHVLIGAVLAVAFAFMAGVLVSRVAHVLGETIDRAQRAQREAERARAELAETLSREVSHRVKNNLAMAAGLLQLRMKAESDPHAAEVLRDTVSQLYAFADIHDQMSRASDGDVDVLETLRRLVRWIEGVFPEGYVALSVEGEEVACPAKEATTFSVIANELITNAIKHGAPDAEGRRRVETRLVRDGAGVSLSVWNSGNPVPPDFKPGEGKGMGLTLVRSLVVDQLGGSFGLEPREGGTLARVDLGESCLGSNVR
jgi:two-component sensor histidine kinase